MSVVTRICRAAMVSAVVSFVSATPGAARDRPPEEICDWSAVIGASAEGAPLSYMRALTRTETGRARNGALEPWPWTVNMEGLGRWFDTREAAIAYVKKEMRRGARSFDVGCFQINYRWHGEHFASVEAMFDPVANAQYAARFLSELRREGGNWRWAVGRYHSRTPALAARYGARFDRIHASLPSAAEATARLAGAPTVRARPPRGVVVSFPRFERNGASLAAPVAERNASPLLSDRKRWPNANGPAAASPGGVVLRLDPAKPFLR